MPLTSKQMNAMRKQSKPEPKVNTLVGCNVRGRLECILEDVRSGDKAEAMQELKDLLKFFPEDED